MYRDSCVTQGKDMLRRAAAEGCVLLENRNQCLPICADEKVAVFGRIQLHYYKSGAGSGGLVNTEYTVGIPEGLRGAGVHLDEEVMRIYREWVDAHPFDVGNGWGLEPRCQEEMPLPESVAAEAAERCTMALVILGRLAGEDFDHLEEEGSYLLTQTEWQMLRTVRKAFSRMAVVLNSGSLMDLSWVDSIQPDGLLLAWNGGQEGGNGVADVLTGKVNPCGHLTDTIAYKLDHYPSNANFGNDRDIQYAEDVFVGYRWFETFAPETVRYPFGYGLSYTDFQLSNTQVKEKTVYVTVQNTGNVPGRQVVQLYARLPRGKLSKPSVVLVDFAKTRLLQPGESQCLTFDVDLYRLSSYDDSGCTGFAYHYVLEAGNYVLLAGPHCQELTEAGCITVPETRSVRRCEQALAPVRPFLRRTENGWEMTPVREYDLQARIRDRRPADASFTGDLGYRLKDVHEGTVSLEDFLKQLSDGDLACLCRGEGMSSPRVTSGTAGAIGGVSTQLVNFGLPAACCADGPSGIRMDSGAIAFSYPCGTMLACTFDKQLNEELFSILGAEMNQNQVDVLLGPGMNLHRHPLNGRNFEYFSEDPVVTGEIGAAQLRGLHKQGAFGCLKHFFANNQEHCRHDVSSNISERAIREIYLKGFEIAVMEGNAQCIMTSYGAVNGIWTAGNYDLNTTILRNDWGFRGIVMTDWWAKINEEGQQPRKDLASCMVRSQNDLYMVNDDPENNSGHDDLPDAINSGKIRRGELLRCAENICRFLLKTKAMYRLMHPEEAMAAISKRTEGNAGWENQKTVDAVAGKAADLEKVLLKKGQEVVIHLRTNRSGKHRYCLTVSSEASELAQMPISLYRGISPMATHTFHGTEGKTVDAAGEVTLDARNSVIRIRAGQAGVCLHRICFEEVD